MPPGSVDTSTRNPSTGGVIASKGDGYVLLVLICQERFATFGGFGENTLEPKVLNSGAILKRLALSVPYPTSRFTGCGSPAPVPPN